MIFKQKLLLTIACLSTLLTGCFEFDYLSIEIEEDLSNTLQFVVTKVKDFDYQANPSYDFGIESFEQFEKCGFLVKETNGFNQQAGFLVKQEFKNLEELQLAINCTDMLELFNIQVDYDESFLAREYSINLQYPSASEEDWQVKDGHKQIDFPAVKRIKMSLPGKISSSETMTEPIELEKNEKFNSVTWNFSNHARDERLKWWIATEPISIVANSQKSNLDYKWTITTIITITGLIFGTGIIKRFSKQNS